MRSFVVLCFVAVACADRLGYNYQPVGNSNSGNLFTPAASNAAPAFAAAPAHTFGAPIAAQSANAPAFASPDYAQTAAAPSYAAPAELQKEFFTYSADDNDFRNPAASEQVASNLKHSLRVVFVKGPEHDGLEDAALALAKQAAEQKTAIYVLNKLADIGDLANKLNAVGTNNNNKPEVHFVKYRTPEDAANAQRAIQNQYDSLGGSSQVREGGVAPTLNFASKAPVPAASAPAPAVLPIQSANAPTISTDATAPSSTYVPAPRENYLPASIFRTVI